MKLKRDFPGMFDVLKGLLILTVILAHQKGYFQNALQVDHPLITATSLGEEYDVVFMGMFFMAAGYTSYAEKDLKGYVRKSAKSILVPYFWTMAAMTVLKSVQYLLFDEFSLQAVSPIILGFLYGDGVEGKLFGIWQMSAVGAAWFLPALFWSGVFHQLLLRIRRPVAREVLIFGLALAAAAFPSAHEIQLPWSLIPGCTAVGFRETGRLLKENKILYKKINWPFACAAIASTLILQHISAAKFWSNIWRFWIVDYASAVAVGIVLMQFYIQSGLAVAEFTDAVAYVGRYSLYFFCIHNVEMMLFPWYKTYTHVFVPLGIPWWAIFLIMFIGRVIFIAVGCWLIVWVSRRFKKIRRLQT